MLEVSKTKIKDSIACKGRLSFPSLKSLTLNHEATRALQDLLSKDLFDSLIQITSSQLEELDCPYLGRSELSELMRNGQLGLLKTFTLTRGYVNYDYDVDDVEYGVSELIKHCPNITNVDGYTRFEDDGLSWYTRGALAILSTYGPQLKYFNCNLVSRKILHAIAEKCKNIQSLVLNFEPYACSAGQFDECVAVANSAPLLLGSLERLTHISLYFIDSNDENETIYYAETIGELVKRCGMRLRSFHLTFYGFESHKIIKAIGANLKNLKKLNISMNRMEDTEPDTARDIYETKELQESVEYMLDGCQKLRILHLDVHGWSDVFYTIQNNICEQICYKQKNLRYLDVKHIEEISRPTVTFLYQCYVKFSVFEQVAILAIA
eukprot:Seg2240.1 transcript_id=Seg2240.1/GoldUCD/mRNA.D3Y31 product="hypothetical protein" protein_id=Seg2240.1/GoldUCD/D3Y31